VPPPEPEIVPIIPPPKAAPPPPAPPPPPPVLQANVSTLKKPSPTSGSVPTLNLKPASIHEEMKSVVLKSVRLFEIL
jgi:hypothetical protein